MTMSTPSRHSGRPLATLTSSSRPRRSAFSRAASAASGERSEAVTGGRDAPTSAPARSRRSRCQPRARGRPRAVRCRPRPAARSHAAARARAGRRDLELAEGGAFEHVGQRLVISASCNRRFDRRHYFAARARRPVAGKLLDADAKRVGDKASASERGSANPPPRSSAPRCRELADGRGDEPPPLQSQLRPLRSPPFVSSKDFVQD